VQAPIAPSTSASAISEIEESFKRKEAELKLNFERQIRDRELSMTAI
jgi:hypothetical protein